MQTPSTSAPIVSIGLNVCAVTPGLVSFHWEPVPCAGGGDVDYFIFDDTACGNEITILDWYKTGDNFECYSEFKDGSMAAIMLSCTSEDEDPGSPTSTTTISVGPVAAGAIAPASPASATGNTGGTGGSGTNQDSGSASASNSSDSNSKFGSGWDSLPLGGRIAIIVVLAALGAGGGGITIKCCINKRRKHQFEGDFPQMSPALKAIAFRNMTSGGGGGGGA
jgi:hypothetical protein